MSVTSHNRPHFGFIPGISVGVTLSVLLGCGAVGPPLPPEKIGIEVKIRQQRTEENAGESKQETVTPIGEDEVVLPPLQPVGIN